ncbi:PH domain-containing protein [Thermodesulfobacteriota bacterium]
MRQLKSLLRDNERIIHREKLHWIVVMVPLVVLLVSFPGAHVLGGAGMAIVGALFKTVASVWLIFAVIDYLISGVVLTDQRLVAKSGLFRRTFLDLSLESLAHIEVIQSPWGRRLGYGSLLIQGDDEQSQVVPKVPHPHQVVEKAYEAVATFKPAIIDSND